MPSSETYTHERASFVERIQRLGGSTTWREPMQGGGCGSDKVPDIHSLAAALAYANDGGVGHRVAFEMYVGNGTQVDKIIEATADQVRDLESRIRNRRGKPSKANRIARSALAEIVSGKPEPRPYGEDSGWDMLVGFTVRWLLTIAEQALVRAERAYRRRS